MGAMVDWGGLAARVGARIGANNVLVNEPMSAHTTLRVGGPAAVYAMPCSAEDALAAVAVAREAHVPYFVLGRGSNLLVADAGYAGVVIAVGDGLANVAVDGASLVCEAGVGLADASEMACELGLAGLEFACGIPGSVGGAVYMNAGAYGGCVADVVSGARVLAADGDVLTLSADKLGFGYRASRVRAEGMVVLAATFALRPGDPAAIRATMDELTARREAVQPLELASAGSTFKRPVGHYAGKLIADAGLKGYRVGDAAVSSKHAGFVVNLGNATATELCAVIAHVQATVLAHSGVALETEVQLLGF